MMLMMMMMSNDYGQAWFPKGPSAQIVGFQGPKNHSVYGFGDLKPYYLGTRTLWG